MMDLYFFLKSVILTIALVVLLQLEVGGRTLETRATMMFKGSLIEAPLNKVAQGGAKMVRETIALIKSKVDGNSQHRD